MVHAGNAKRLFGTSGIRGGFDRVNPMSSMNLGRALGTLLKGNGIVAVGTDARTSRVMLHHAFVSGLLSTGVDVVDLGIVPMPATGFQSSLASIDVGVIITASHNPPTDNGFKFFRNGREFLRSEEVEVEKHYFGQDFLVADWNLLGTKLFRNIRTPYMQRIKTMIVKRGGMNGSCKVLVDAANGAASNYTPHLLQSFGFSVVTVNSHQDGHFPGRPAEPSPRNLEFTMNMAAESDFAVTVCHDGDGDRLAVIDEKGRFIDQNRVIALFAKYELEEQDGGLVVVSIDTSNVIDEIVRSHGGEVVRRPLGSLQEELALRYDRIVFASEPWKPIFTELGGWMDGIAGAVRLAQLVVNEGDGSCIELMKQIPEYPMVRDFIACPDPLKKDFMQEVRKILPEKVSNIDKILEVDGVRVERNDGSYLLVRVSGTEPKARFYVGGRTQQSVDALAATAKKTMTTILDALEGNQS
ncbi:phosphoglucosamine mutase [Candidatus Thorarchaeota archaeon]|nr:MAG: phosphoglucosamine mutase [Candidatus Thorarchaeota archaeon]